MATTQMTDTLERTLDLFRNSPDPVLTAADVADAFDITSQAANQRLDRLVEQNQIEEKKVGAAAVIYWLPED